MSLPCIAEKREIRLLKSETENTKKNRRTSPILFLVSEKVFFGSPLINNLKNSSALTLPRVFRTFHLYAIISSSKKSTISICKSIVRR